MSKIIIKKTTATKVFKYAGEELNVKGEVVYDPKELVAERISGSFYEKADSETGINGDIVGSFDGYYEEGHLKYSIRNMTAENAMKVVSLIAEVDDYVQEIIQTDEE